MRSIKLKDWRNKLSLNHGQNTNTPTTNFYKSLFEVFKLQTAWWCEKVLRRNEVALHQNENFNLHFIKRIQYNMNLVFNKHQNDYSDDSSKCLSERFHRMRTSKRFLKVSPPNELASCHIMTVGKQSCLLQKCFSCVKPTVSHLIRLDFV